MVASAYTKMVRLGEAVPADDNVPSLIYQLQSAAGFHQRFGRSLRQDIELHQPLAISGTGRLERHGALQRRLG